MRLFSTLKSVSTLVSPKWLQNNLTTKNVRILDTSWSVSESFFPKYCSKHIPTAQYFDLNQCCLPTKYTPCALPNLECFGAYLSNMGIGPDTHVIFYDRNGMTPSARAWSTLRIVGHNNVSVLDGGFASWEANGGDVEKDSKAKKLEKRVFKVSFFPNLVKEFTDVTKNIESKEFIMMDARKAENYQGLIPEPSPATVNALKARNFDPPLIMQGGHIPGSINIFAGDVINKENGHLKDKEDLEDLFEEKKIDFNMKLSALCYNGNSACLLSLACHKLGKKDVSVYYGSWTEYGQKANNNQVTKSTF